MNDPVRKVSRAQYVGTCLAWIELNRVETS